MDTFNTTLCPNCKTVIQADEISCPICGQNLQAVSFEDQRILYIQTNVETYLKKFNALEMKERKTGWNWCGFLFGPLWMLYRKLYGYAAFFYLAPIFIEVILMYISPSEMFYATTNLLCTLVMYVCGGLYSDYWYKMKIDRLMQEGLRLNGEAKAKHLKKGGTNFTLIAILMVIDFILSTVFSI